MAELRTVLDENDIRRSVWHEDAPTLWARLAHRPARRLAGDTGAVLVTSAKGARRVLLQHRAFPHWSAVLQPAPLIPIDAEPPEHSRYRKMLDPFFGARAVATLRDDVRRVADQCIDRFLARGSCNFSREFAEPLPAATILGLLGLPMEDLDRYLALEEALLRGEEQPSGAAATREAVVTSIRDQVLAALEGANTSAGSSDLLAHLRTLESAGELSREESLGILHLLFVAGLDTVSGSLEVIFAILAQREDLQVALAQGPESWDTAVEELLRLSTVTAVQTRMADEDGEVDGCPIRRGDRMYVMQATLNFDPDTFDEPLEIRLDRRNARRHASFGVGIHRCLGEHLAKLELRVALERWHARIPEYRLAEDQELTYKPGVRGVRDLPIVFPSSV